MAVISPNAARRPCQKQSVGPRSLIFYLHNKYRHGRWAPGETVSIFGDFFLNKDRNLGFPFEDFLGSQLARKRLRPRKCITSPERRRPSASPGAWSRQDKTNRNGGFGSHQLGDQNNSAQWQWRSVKSC